jgi:MoxR-like ATPase
VTIEPELVSDPSLSLAGPRLSEMEEAAAAVRESPIDHLQDILRVSQAEIAKAVVGQEKAVEMILVALLARCHVLLEGPPGTGKTLLAQAVARLLGARFRRVQFTPDTTPEEITGWERNRGGEKVFEKGAVFTNVLLADEINRTPARTQAALLEAMQERSVTVKGETYRLESPFFVMATQNPYEQEGVYALPESQLDRFLFRVNLDYGTEESELAMLDLPRRGVSPDVIGDLVPLLGERGVLLVQDAVDAVEIPDNVALAAVRLVRGTRAGVGITLGAGPRATIHVITGAKARATLRGDAVATVADVVAVAREALPHRILADEDGETVVDRVADEVERAFN